MQLNNQSKDPCAFRGLSGAIYYRPPLPGESSKPTSTAPARTSSKQPSSSRNAAQPLNTHTTRQTRTANREQNEQQHDVQEQAEEHQTEQAGEREGQVGVQEGVQAERREDEKTVVEGDSDDSEITDLNSDEFDDVEDDL